MIHEILPTGAVNAVPGKQLAESLGLDHRTLTRLVEKERQSGWAICAGVTEDSLGYFLAADAGELALYLRSLNRRIKNVTKTYRALDIALSQMEGQEQVEGWGDNFE